MVIDLDIFILRCILIDVLKELIHQYPDRASKFINGFLFDIFLYIPDGSNKDFDYQMFYRITEFLSSLQVRGDKILEIDMDNYFEFYLDETQVRHRRLKEDII